MDIKNLVYILHMILPFIYILGAYFAGLIFENILIRRLKKIPALREIRGNEMIKTSKGPVLLLFVIAGTYAAVSGISTDIRTAGFILKALLIVAIILLTMITANICGGLISIYSNKEQNSLPATSILINISRIIIFIVGSLIILEALGVSITPILTALGVGGLAVALALKDTLTNLFSGLNILASKQIRQGDYIKLDSNEEGYIVDITWRDTIIKSGSNNLVIIPNQKLASAVITNFYNPDKQVPVVVPLCVDTHSDLEKVEKISIRAASDVMKSVEGAVPDYEPVVRFTGFSDAGINLNVIMRADEVGCQFIIKHEFIKRLYKEFEAENIGIAFPLAVGFSIKTKRENE